MHNRIAFTAPTHPRPHSIDAASFGPLLIIAV